MFDFANYSGDDRWLATFTEASVRLDALETAISDLRRLLRNGQGVQSTEILEVLERHGV